jgi:hypothetical protein
LPSLAHCTSGWHHFRGHATHSGQCHERPVQHHGRLGANNCSVGRRHNFMRVIQLRLALKETDRSNIRPHSAVFGPTTQPRLLHTLKGPPLAVVRAASMWCTVPCLINRFRSSNLTNQCPSERVFVSVSKRLCDSLNETHSLTFSAYGLFDNQPYRAAFPTSTHDMRVSLVNSRQPNRPFAPTA